MWSPTESLGRENCSWTLCQRIVPSSVLMAFFPLFLPEWDGSLQGAPERPSKGWRRAAQSSLPCSHHPNSRRGKTLLTRHFLCCALGLCVMGRNSRRWLCWFQALIPSSVGPASNRWVKWRKIGAFFILINPAELWAFLQGSDKSFIEHVLHQLAATLAPWSAAFPSNSAQTISSQLLREYFTVRGGAATVIHAWDQV